MPPTALVSSTLPALAHLVGQGYSNKAIARDLRLGRPAVTELVSGDH